MAFDDRAWRELSQRLDSTQIDANMKYIANDLVLRLQRRVKQKTKPHTQYEKGSGRVGGTLRRNWKIDPATKNGDKYTAILYNNTEYAIYVEYGHRQEVGRYIPAIGKRLINSWCDGRFYLTNTLNEFDPLAPKIIQKHVNKMLKDLLNGNN